MNVVLYLRYSSDKQNEQSIEGQQRICADYCKRNNMNIVNVYIDRALSASKNAEKRLAFQKMIRDSEKGTFDAVIVYKLDRFARNRYDSATYKSKLSKNGVRVISATEGISDNPEGIILESLLEGMAEYYSKELSQKVTRGMNETALKCNSCGGSIPLGYKVENKKLVIDETKAPIVKEIFERYAAGEKVSEICKDLNERGLRTSTGALFNKHSFSNMFKNEKYIGVYKYKNIRIEGGVPAIIDKELFEKIQEKIEKNKEAPARNKAKIEYLLSGKIYCGHCGSNMIGDSGTGATGTRYYYYACSKKKNSRSCDKKNVNKEWIEDIVIKDTAKLLTHENIEKLADMAISAANREARENTDIITLNKELESVERAITNLLKLVERGSDSESLFNRLSELENQRKQINVSLMDAQKEIVVLEKPHVVWWLTQFADMDTSSPEHRRQLINMLVNTVTVWDDPDDFRITITYNLTSKPSKKIKCSDLSSNGSPKKITSELLSLDVIFLSKPQAWYGITRQRVWHRLRRMASPKVYFLRLDYIRDYVAIPFRNELRIPYTPTARFGCERIMIWQRIYCLNIPKNWLAKLQRFATSTK